MKQLFTSDYAGFDESATKVTIISFDYPGEQEWFLSLSHREKCKLFNVFDEGDGFGVPPGGTYHTYDFDVTDGILAIYDTIALNV